MNINVWNLSQTKTSFFIRQRTEAQKKHLSNLKKVKSNIDIRNFAHTAKRFRQVYKSRISESKENQKAPELFSVFDKQNSIIDSISGKAKGCALNASYVDNLRISSSLLRLRHKQEIQKENCKIIERIIKTKPSLSEIQLKKNHLNHLKYKHNILKNKYINPDYTLTVKESKKSLSHLLLKPLQNLSRIERKSVRQQENSAIQKALK